MTNLENLLVCVAELNMAENEPDRKKAKKKLRQAIEDTKSNIKTAEVLVHEILADMGAPESLLGYPYLVDAILLCIEQPDMINHITFGLYPTIGARFDTTASRTERAIRHVIEVICSRGDSDVLYKYFKNTISPDKGKPTNGEFIAKISNIVRRQLQA